MATISFARGAPSLDIVDVEGLKEAARLAFSSDPAGTTAYGTSVGYVPLREWIAEQHGVAVEQVLVTNGSMQADAFLFELLVQQGDAVIVENPTYDRTLLNLRARGADVRFVDLEDDGISIAGVEEVLGTAVHPKLAHIIPNFQNPAGYTLSAEKRTKLLELAVEHDFTIFEDDPYVAIRFEGESIPTMLSQDEAGRVVYASSFSKTVCPGIRVGYLVGPQAVIKQIQTLATNTYISPNMVAQSIVNQFARSGRMDGAIETVKTALKARKDAVVGALQREIPDAKFANPSGGYFMWVELPEGVDVAELEKAAAQRDVQFVKGTDFGGASNTLRLAYSGVTPEQIDEGITKLADALKSLGVAAS
jgi:2-aminoadipate transaminase